MNADHLVTQHVMSECSETNYSAVSDLPSLLLSLTIEDDHQPTLNQPNRLWSTSNIAPAPAYLTSPPELLSNAVQASIHAIINGQHSTVESHSSSRPTASQTSKNSNAWCRKANAIIAAVELEIQQVAEGLSFSDEAVPAPTTLQPLLDQGEKVVKSTGVSLASVKNGDKEVQEYKMKVLSLLRTLDSRISQLGGLFPRRCETRPVNINAGEFSV